MTTRTHNLWNPALHTTRGSVRRAALRACVVALVAATLPVPAAVAAQPTERPRALVLAPEDAERAAAAVAAEDRRLTEIRTVSSLARWQGESWKAPFRMSTGTGYSLVLTPRSSAYTVQDLLALAPQTFLAMSDGSYLLSEHVVVTAGATLRLAQPGGLTLRLASGPSGFTSIVSTGGKLEIVGEQGAPVRVTSWNLDRAEPDFSTADGRAYLRAVGGQVEASYLHGSHLGFWSGRTGGLALTGTDRPNTGAIRPVGDVDLGGAGVPSILEGVSTQPAGPLMPGQTNPSLGWSVPAADYVSTRISDTELEGNAFGLFVSGADGVQVEDTTVRDSLINGIVLHRYVRNGVLTRTTARDNAGNGFTLARATTGITVSEAIATGNERDGISVSGRALAEGPSASGASTASYGGNSVVNSTVEANGHYGIAVTGGYNVGVQNNRVAGGDMGIVVTGPAERISVTGNDVTGTERHGIGLVDGVRRATVTGNVVDGASTGVYVRASAAEVKGNTVQEARVHGVSLVGEVSGSAVALNVLAGRGASALDTSRSSGGAELGENQMTGWDDTTPWWTTLFHELLQPMTALWALIIMLVGTSAARSRRRNGRIAHPYAHQMAHQGDFAIPLPGREGEDSRDGEGRSDQRPVPLGSAAA